MTRNWFALGACLWMLAGCAHFSSRQSFPKHYTLTGSPAPAQQALPPTSRQATLQVARITVAPWLQGTALYYRLDYRHDDRIAAYAQSDWVSPPAQLLAQNIRNAIARDGGWRVVTGPAGPTGTDFSLHIGLDDFSQAFASPGQSRGVLDATATLVDNRSGNAIAQKHFQVDAPAPSADAQGGVNALNHAALQFTAELERWLRNVRAARSESP
ncbi:MAG TPA: ABC-type transport auxiliary lipoprotein family protein [Rhodanobacteraceae bacterium]|nr:ABC-type transport auxiliary lipoprotein family protein [Rhodanobacteraceae bacterium]